MNLYALENPKINAEIFQLLHRSEGLRIEVIKSSLRAPGKIYNQEEDEWVVLLQGNAKLMIHHEEITLREGESVFLPKHTPHQVLSTSENTIWLAVFSS